MRAIPAVIASNSSSSSQEPVNASPSRSAKQQQQQGGNNNNSTSTSTSSTTLIGDISTLRSRLQELDSHESTVAASTTTMNSNNGHGRPRSQTSMDGGRREPPQQAQQQQHAGPAESNLVYQLRQELKSMEAQKAELELTLMNQMSNLAYENQSTIDGLHSKLAASQSEQLMLQEGSCPNNTNNSNTNDNSLEDRLRQSLAAERKRCKVLEEKRDSGHQQVRQLQEDRETAEHENSTLQEGLMKMQQHMDILHSSNQELTKHVRSLEQQENNNGNGGEQSQGSIIQSLESQVANQQTRLADVERSHQGQMSEIKQSYQQRYSALEKQLFSQTPDRNQSGVGHLHRKIAELETENDELSLQVMNMGEKLDGEQSMNAALESSLEEQTNNSAKLWESLEENQQRCEMLQKQVNDSNANNNINSNNNQGKNDASLRSENEMLSNQIAAIHEQCVSEQEKCAKFKASLEAERATNSKLRLSLRQHQQRYEELNRNLHRNQSGIGMVNKAAPSSKAAAMSSFEKEKAAKEKAALQNHLNQERSKIRELEAALAKRQNDHQEQLQSTAGRRQSDVAALESAQLELQSVMNSYQSDVARLERKVKLSDQTLAEQNRQNQRLEVEINEERRIRKSLTAQLTQLKMASKQQSSTTSAEGGASNNADINAELQRLQKDNFKLTDDLKHRASLAGQVDPAELEFLRKQNRMLGERADGLHGEQMKEMEILREKNMLLTAELSKLNAIKKSTAAETSHRSSPGGSFLYKDQMAELDKFKQHNVDLVDELNTLKQSMTSSHRSRSATPQSPNRINGCLQQPSSPRRNLNSRPSSPRAPPIPNTLRSEAFQSGMQTPPLSPPLMRKKPGSSRTPVQGIVESFERRISRTNSCSSLTSAAEAAQAQLAVDQQATSALNAVIAQGNVAASQQQAHDAASTELDAICRELDEEKASVQALQEKYDYECKLVQDLHKELTKMENSESKHGQLEQSLKDREQDVMRMRAKINELEDIALEVGGMQDSIDQDKKRTQELQSKLDAQSELVLALENEVSKFESEKTVVQELQQKLDAESELVSELQTEVGILEQNEERRAMLEEQSKVSELEIKRLRSKVANLEMMLSTAQSQASNEEDFDRLNVELMQADAARQGFEQKLFQERAEMQKLQTEMLSSESLLEQREAELQKIREEITFSKSSNEKLERRKQEDEDLIERLQTELGAARMGLEISLDELERLKSTSHDSSKKNLASAKKDEAEIVRLRSDLVDATHALDVNIEAMEGLQKMCKDADASRMIAVRQSMSSRNEGQQSMDKLMAELVIERSNSQNQAEEVDRLRSQVAALQQELGEAMVNVEELQKVISSIQNAHDSELQDQQKIGTRSSKTIGKEMQTLEVELTKNQISRADMQMGYMSKIHDLENKLDTMQDEMDDELKHKVLEMNRLQMTLTSKENEIRALTKEREQICSSMSNLSSSRKGDIDELQEELLKLTAKTAAQTREIQSLKMNIEEHDFRKSEFERLKERITDLEEELVSAPPQKSDASHSDIAIMKAENKMLRESIRDLGMERRQLQEKLEALLLEKTNSKSGHVLRERNAALKTEVERLTKRLKKMEHSMTRFTI